MTAPAGEAQLVETALLAPDHVSDLGGQQGLARGDRRRGPRRSSSSAAAARMGPTPPCTRRAPPSSPAARRRRICSPAVASAFRSSGTMAHSWVMGFADEIDAFRQYMQIFGEHTHAAHRHLRHPHRRPPHRRQRPAADGRAARQRRSAEPVAASPRRSSTREGSPRRGSSCRAISTSIAFRALLQGGAPIDGFGVGTAISVVSDAPALGGVYKLVETMEAGQARPTVKLSTGKRTFPGRKQVWRVTEDGMASARRDGARRRDPTGWTAAAVAGDAGRGTRAQAIPLAEVQARCAARVAQLPAALRALEPGPPYTVRISSALDRLARSAVTRAEV